MTSVHFFARGLPALRAASDRALALNPLNTGVLTWVGTGGRRRTRRPACPAESGIEALWIV